MHELRILRYTCNLLLKLDISLLLIEKSLLMTLI